MDFNYLTLLAWVTQTLVPAELMGKDLTSAEFENWKKILKTESNGWRMMMSFHLLGTSDDNEKRRWLKAQQQQIVMLSNQLNYYLFREQKQWSGHPQATQIKNHYGQALACFEELISFAEQQFPAYYDSTEKITHFGLRNVIPGLRHLIVELKTIFAERKLDHSLSNIVIKTINDMLVPGKLSGGDVKYLMYLIHEIKCHTDLNNLTFVELLIKLDFNQPELYLYQANAMSIKLQQIDGLHEELEYVLQQREDLRNNKVQKYISLYPYQPQLKQELNQYYSEKATYLEKLLQLRRTALQDRHDSEHAFRILVGMSVPQLALFIRVLKEKEVILREGITEVLTFFSRHFYTDKALFISSHNLLKRSSDVEFGTVLKLWDTLDGMMNWLDEKYDVRNYQRSQ